jgi:hypothetical protein
MFYCKISYLLLPVVYYLFSLRREHSERSWMRQTVLVKRAGCHSWYQSNSEDSTTITGIFSKNIRYE